ncbi:HTH-type transcriptional regulator DmlR [Marinomonas aquimarina]|uniref:HTH-type transcriptional regulator DmlR n=1 Tax=Marinomonas aquimarina TaxID=295068 RepID=A0A1A8T8L9_9GAMM|nr:LysR family transcriptional regulator [Marinomonas aquimarina]SBS28242.1 HTH-type transcriptional regulator DmlR [Marinomonas aquimarina]
MYDLNDLKSFVSVVETGNLSASAKELGVSKSTLSRRISHLEDVMRQPLMRRQANRMFANDAGRAFLPFARNILDTVHRAHRTVDELKETVSGKVNFAIFSGLSRSWVNRELFHYLAQYPDINVDVYTISSIEELRAETDVAIWMGNLKEMSFKSDLLGEMGCSLYASQSYVQQYGLPNTMEQLEQHDWVNLHSFYSNEQTLSLYHAEQGYQEIVMPQSRLSTDLLSFHIDGIVNGKGIGVIPDAMVEARAKHHPNDMVRVMPEWRAPSIPVYLLYAYGHLPKRSQVLLQQLKKAYLAHH